MPIAVSCHCGQRFQARDELAGRRTKCSHCGGELIIGDPNGARARQTAVDPLAGHRELTMAEMIQLANKIQAANVAGPLSSNRADLGLAHAAPPSPPPGPPGYAAMPVPRANRGLVIGVSGGAIVVVLIGKINCVPSADHEFLKPSSSRFFALSLFTVQFGLGR